MIGKAGWGVVAFNGPSPSTDVSSERYLNHPTFGMLYRVAPVAEGRDLFATLYAQRIFFVVTLQTRGASFEVIPLMDARHYAEQNLVRTRREGEHGDYARWRQLFDQTFI
jgi:PII interaction protein X